MDKLNFVFLPHDDMLEATCESGFYHIYQCGDRMRVCGYSNGKTFDIGDFADIYSALDEANQHYRYNHAY